MKRFHTIGLLERGLCGRRVPRFAHGVPLLFAAALTALPPAAFAQTKPISILITGSRSAETADPALVPVSVITRDDIEEMQADTVEDVLRTVPGIMITRHGGIGRLSSLFLRGVESNHVLFLIDGMNVGNATNSLPPFPSLSLDQIEKIEVVRGPRTNRYGPQAIGGVVQIFTKRGGEQRTTAKTAVGSHKNAQMGMDMSGGGDGPGWYRISASESSTSGFDACRGGLNHQGTGMNTGCSLPEDDSEDDRDGHTNRSVSLNTGMKADRFSMEASLLSSDNEVEYDGGFSHYTLSSVRNTRVKADMRPAEFWSSSLNVGESQVLTDNFKDGEFKTKFDTVREQASWQNDFTIGERHRLTAGADQLKDRVNSTTPYAVTKTETTGAFLSWRVDTGSFDAEASVRNDNYQRFGDNTTGDISWGKNLGDMHRVVISFGTGFNTPTLNDLYWPLSPTPSCRTNLSECFRGNPDLEPETSESIDLEFSGRNLGVNWTLNAFHTQIDNLIELGRHNGNRSVVNVDTAVSRGVELAGTLARGPWNFKTTLTAQEPKATGGATAGKRLARRAKTIFNFDATRNFGKYSLGASAHGQSASFDDPANTRRVGGYGVADLRGELRLRHGWTLALRVNNIFDKKYETVLYYPQDGTNFLLTLRHASGAR